jgi:UPF0755 protein
MKKIKNVGQILAFSVTVMALAAALGSAVRFFNQSVLGLGSVSIGLCGASSPDDFLIGFYLEANADLLEQPAGNDDTPIPFVIEPGETAVEISNRLKQEGLISDAELFRRYAQYHGLDAGIEAGKFTLRQTMTIPEIAQALQQGRRPEQVVTIQEGLRLEQIAVEVASQTSVSYDEFFLLATTGWRDMGFSFDFLTEVPLTATLEGFLFPETYRLPEDATAADVLERMLSTFDARVTPEMRAAAANRGQRPVEATATTGLNVYELVTLASIVEREAVLDGERPIIAGVYLNRLESGWFLDACPTVQYALSTPENLWPQFTLEATEVDSPYNTYRNLGLPPGPICSPGLASIEATAHPADTDYYFFLADCTKDDGSHLFAVTQEQHLSNYQMCGGEIQ